MRLAAAIVIVLPLLCFLMLSRRRADSLNPYSVFTFLYAIKIVLPTIIYSYPDNISIADHYFLENALSNDGVFLKYTLLQSIGYCCVLLGLNLSSSNISYVSYSEDGHNLNYKQSRKYKLWGYILYALGIWGFLLTMFKVGGIAFFYSNLGLRTYLVRDLDFELYLLSLLNYAPLLIVYSKKWSHSKISIIEIILIVLAGLMVGLGGRKALLMLAIQCVVIYHYVVTPINVKKILSLKFVSLILLMFFFFTTFSKLRTEGAADEFLHDPIAFYMDNNQGGIKEALAGESYVPFYVAIVDYFDKHDNWGGATFTSIASAFLPSSFYPQKPPVDDGMYLYSIAHGKQVSPPMPAKSLDGTSWPLETFGAMYANFGLWSVPFGMLIVGLTIGFVFKRMVRLHYPFKFVLFYVFVLFTFEVSTLRIVQAIITFVMLSVVQFIIDRKYA